MILGYQGDDALEAYATIASAPTAFDEQSRFRVFRSSAHNAFAVSAYEASGGREDYLGLWHTHPESDPSPSSQDLRDWRRALKRGSFNGAGLFFLIVGCQKIRCWFGRRPRPFRSVGFVELEMALERS